MNRNDILQILSEKRGYLKFRYGFETMMLFGSYAKNEANENSDIDIAVTLPSEFKTLDNLLDSKKELSSMLGGKKIDLLYYNAINLNPIIKTGIDEEQITVE